MFKNIFLLFLLSGCVSLASSDLIEDISKSDLKTFLASDFVSDSRNSQSYLKLNEDSFLEIKNKFINLISSNKDSPQFVLDTLVLFQRAGGIFGDPHFIIPLSSGQNICFNWANNGDEFDNIISTSTHFINARMKPHKIMNSTRKKVFMTEIAIILPRNQLALMFFPDRIEVEKSKLKTNLDIKTFKNYTSDDVIIRFDKISSGSSYVTVVTYNSTYKMVLRHGALSPHINLYFSNLTETCDEDGKRYHGLAGQFCSEKLKILPVDRKHAVIQFGNLEASVRRHVTHGKKLFTGTNRQCWLVTRGSEQLLSYNSDKFRVDTLLSQPSYF